MFEVMIMIMITTLSTEAAGEVMERALERKRRDDGQLIFYNMKFKGTKTA